MKESETTHNKYGLADLSNEKSVYDYSIMKNLPPMDVAIMPDFRTVKETERVSSSNAIEIAMKDAASIGKVMDNGNVVAQNKYTECGIVISRTSLKHSLNGGATRLRTNACLAAIAGQLVQNAVPINALHNESKTADGTYAMACLAASGEKMSLPL